MEKEFVSYEIALELKQLGFDEPCFGYFQENKTKVIIDNSGLITNSNFSKIFSEDRFRLVTPLYQQVFRWFREKYGVYTRPEKFDEKTWWVEWGGWNSSICETYEEAEHEWLLKLIETVKTK
jgi:hypothetical protein